MLNPPIEEEVVNTSIFTDEEFIDYVQNNLFQTFLNPSYSVPSSYFYNNEKLRIMNGNFSFGGVDFKNEYIYYYDTIIAIIRGR